jgi:hypothetical protein
MRQGIGRRTEGRTAPVRGSTWRTSAHYRINPEDFLRVACRLIIEQKATVIVEYLTYSATDETYGIDIFTQERERKDFSKAVKTKLHIYDYVFTDSESERNFVRELDTGTDVEVYSKLPKSFFIPTPVGSYSPDWAIVFRQGTVKHIYFIAETKGSMVHAGEIHAAAQHQLLRHSPLEAMMPLLHIAVLVAMPGLRLLALQSIATHQPLVAIRELARIAHVVHRRRKPVGAMAMRYFTQRPQRVLQPFAQALEALKSTPLLPPSSSTSAQSDRSGAENSAPGWSRPTLPCA